MPIASSKEGSITSDAAPGPLSGIALPSLGPENVRRRSFDEDFRVTWDGSDDPSFPMNFSTSRKWTMVIVVCTATICTTFTSSVYTTTYDQLRRDFGASTFQCAWGLSSFVLGIALGPLIAGPASEHYGRRPVYLVSWSAFVVTLIPCAAAQNMVALIVTRLFGGFAGSSFLSVAGGTVRDIFDREEIRKPMILFTLAPFVGPSSGPVFGGLINYYLNWRWTYYIVIIWATLILLALVFVAPETYHPAILRAKAQKMRAETGDDRFWAPSNANGQPRKREALLRPFQFLFLEPMCFCLNIYSAILLGILYLFFAKLPETFRATYNMNLWQSCLAFAAIIIGMLLSVATDQIWVAIRGRLMAKREAKTGEKGISEPEYRLPPAIVGGIMVPAGLFWYAWTARSSIFWIVPVLGLVFFGCGVVLVYNGIFTFIVEAYPQYVASALSSNGFSRAFLAAAFPLVAIPLYNDLGSPLGTSVLGIATVIMLPFPWIFFRYGRFLRSKSKFAAATIE